MSNSINHFTCSNY